MLSPIIARNMKHLFIVDTAGEQVYYDHVEGRRLCDILSNNVKNEEFTQKVFSSGKYKVLSEQVLYY